MKKERLYLFCFTISIIIIAGNCTQAYEPAVIKANKNYLVVDGIINSGANSVTTITLSRTRNVTDSIASSPELHAQVSILGKSGNSYFLHEQGNGVYASDVLNLNTSDEYALQISTSGNSTYLSDYISPKKTPAIDSLEWSYAGNGVTIFANTHDPQNNTRYYRWDYIETWQYHAKEEAEVGVNNGLMFYVIDEPDNQKYTCWQTANSTNILLGSSVNLSQDIISHDSITNILQNSTRIEVRYSILLKQYALNQSAYEYYQILQKNTQQLGSLFDAQPTQLTGNIHCVTNPAEPVIGYISASTVEEKRLFINNADVPNWNAVIYSGQQCDEMTIDQNPVNYLIYNYPDPDFAPYYFSGTTSLRIARKTCIDCTLFGGTNQKPSFW